MPDTWSLLLMCGMGSRSCLFAVCPLLLPLLPDTVTMETRVPQQFFCQSYSPILRTCLCHPDRLLRRCCHPTGNGSPCPELLLLLWRQLLARQKGGGMPRDLQCHRGSAGLLLENVTAAAPFSTITPLVFRQKASVSVICPNIAAMSECFPCARHSSQPCPCVFLRFNPPLSLLCRYSSSLDIFKLQFNSVVTECTILQFSFVG